MKPFKQFITEVDASEREGVVDSDEFYLGVFVDRSEERSGFVGRSELMRVADRVDRIMSIDMPFDHAGALEAAEDFRESLFTVIPNIQGRSIDLSNFTEDANCIQADTDEDDTTLKWWYSYCECYSDGEMLFTIMLIAAPTKEEVAARVRMLRANPKAHPWNPNYDMNALTKIVKDIPNTTDQDTAFGATSV